MLSDIFTQMHGQTRFAVPPYAECGLQVRSVPFPHHSPVVRNSWGTLAEQRGMFWCTSGAVRHKIVLQ